jgi:hypothetical protein
MDVVTNIGRPKDAGRNSVIDSAPDLDVTGQTIGKKGVNRIYASQADL